MFNFHDRILADVRKSTGIFRNVKPSSGNWKAGSVGLDGVLVAYMVAKEVTTASIWLHTRSVQPNSAGLHLLKENEVEIQALLKGHELTWREQETSSLDVSIEGIGWGIENAEAKGQLLDVLEVFTFVAKKYVPHLRTLLKKSE